MTFDGTSWRLVALAAATISLAGCIGDGGRADVAETIVGVASDGQALANAGVSITDSSGSDEATTTVTTDANGNFSFQPGARAYPFLLSITSAGKTYYSLVTGADTRVNINPASTIIAQFVFKTGYLSSIASNGALGRLRPELLAQAEQLYLQAVRNDSELGGQIVDASPRTKVYRSESATQRADSFEQYLSSIEVSIRPQDGRMIVLNRLPVRMGKPAVTVHSGSTDDLLTSGLGNSGLLGTAPGYGEGIFTSAASLRKNAIYHSYRALVDMSSAGGWGSLYGPVDPVPGSEYRAFADNGSGRQNVATLVQVPDSFSTAKPCLLVVATPDMRSMYAANPTAEWALRRGCAVAATDKGSAGAESIDGYDGYEIDGRLMTVSDATSTALFRSALDSATRKVFLETTPGRMAFKFAHSQQNPERAWGRNVLDAARFAFYVLNEKYGPSADIGDRKLRVIRPEDTLVLVAGEGEGGTAALAALEQDSVKLVDGAVAAQPQAQLADRSGFSVAQGGQVINSPARSPLDYLTFANLYQPCAGLSSSDAPGASLLDGVTAANRCSALRQSGLLSADSLSGQVAESVQKLREYGWQPEADALHGATYMLRTAGAAMAYVNAYGRFNVGQKLCGLGYGQTNATGSPILPEGTLVAHLFSESSGLPPYGGIDLIYNDAANSNRNEVEKGRYNYGINWKQAVSPTTGKVDYSFDAAYCLRKLAVGKDPVTGAALSAAEQPLADAIQTGVAEAGLTAALQGKPAIILHGRSNSVFPANHSARPYMARSLVVQGAASANLRYYEVLNAQHFEGGLTSLAGFAQRFVPMRPYLMQSLDLLYEHLSLKQPLPDSQVVRTTPRGGSAGNIPAISRSHVPAISAQPASGDQIRLTGGTLSIPD